MLPPHLAVWGQPADANYDESKVPAYTLPDPLVRLDGKRVATAEEWKTEGRPELYRLIEERMFGRVPERAEAAARGAVWQEWDRDDQALGGKAVRNQLVLPLGHGVELDLLIYVPKRTGPVPLFVGLNFGGNHTVHADPAIRVCRSWVRNDSAHGITDNRANGSSRGTASSRWPIEAILERGYGVATMYYGDIDPDFDDGFQNGVHGLYCEPGQTGPKADEWGSIAAWAWGLSRAMDHFATDARIDAAHVAVMGHSRLGKTALWAGARDERFALVVSNNSGCGGAALSRREFGETVRRINTSFPHWFNDVFPTYNERVAELPFDQHSLIALIAPRPVLVCSADEDRWADPRGEFLSALGADGVYRLLGTDGIAVKEMPALKEVVRSRVSYHIRPGKHDVTPYDWQTYLDFADAQWFRE
ncbi:MAG: acetylxylan esterase [Planctomycetes bacterium]|nr:acetylxylan esterase [Planctomycetota bacterium]